MIGKRLGLAAAAAMVSWGAAAEDGDVLVNDDGIPEIVVYGDVEEARRIVLEELAEQGFTDVVDKGDYLRIRNQQNWKGEIRLYDDGWVDMKRQPVRVMVPEVAGLPTPVVALGCLVVPTGCVRIGGQVISRNKWSSQQSRTLGAIAPELQDLADLIADRETEQHLRALPSQLEALWSTGRPLVGEGQLDGVEGRKQALLAFFESRAETVWGDRIRAEVERYIAERVQASSTPFTEHEIAAFNQGRSCARELVIVGR